MEPSIDPNLVMGSYWGVPFFGSFRESGCVTAVAVLFEKCRTRLLVRSHFKKEVVEPNW